MHNKQKVIAFLMKIIAQVFLALIAWFAVIAQYFLMVDNRVAGVGETTVRFFSFFTILTNTLVAVYFTVVSLNLNKKALNFFYRPSTRTAITMYIIVVGLVYQFVLRHIWQPQGMHRVVDELIHTFIPSIVFLYFLYHHKKYRGR